MKITVELEGATHAATLPYAGADRVTVPVGCPACGSNAVNGLGIAHVTHDTYHARAACCGCGALRGVIRTKVSTVFGIEEDERVLAGPWRIY